MDLGRHGRGVTLASVGVMTVMAVVSLAGLAYAAQGLYANPEAALGPVPSTAGILVPGFLGHDVFNLFVALPILVIALCGFTTISLLTVIDRDAVREQLEGQLPARVIGGLLIALGLLTFAQDAFGAVSTALSREATRDPLARAVWSVDLSIELPVMLVGGSCSGVETRWVMSRPPDCCFNTG